MMTDLSQWLRQSEKLTGEARLGEVDAYVDQLQGLAANLSAH
jgi:hypothetical protein